VLGALTIVAFVPLYLAVANLTRHTLRETRAEVARSLGRAVAGRLADDVRLGRDDATLRSIARVSVEISASESVEGDERSATASEGVVAVRLIRVGVGALAPVEAGDARVLAALRQETKTPEIAERATQRAIDGVGEVLEVDVTQATARVQVALRVGDQAARSKPLLRLVAFYMAAFALVMISSAYLLLGRLIVRPIRALVDATSKLEEGTARRLVTSDVAGGASEVVELGRVIARTTAQLVEREETLAAKVAQLEAARADLLTARDAVIRSARLASVGRLAAGLAHEIGNPIAALLGLEDVVLMGELDAETRDLVARMKRETERVHRVLRDLLDFARADRPGAGPTSDEQPAIALAADVIGETRALVEPQRALRDIAIEVDLPASLPPLAIAPSKLQQILLNLLFNAADAIAPGARSSSPSTPTRAATPSARATSAPPGARIVVRARVIDATTVGLAVIDDGPGVADAIAAMLFEPFVTTKEVGEGTGLGLAVCRGLAESVGGSIELARGDATSGLRREGDPTGACFIVRLPIVTA
jgi:signal transduction histidine kinase